MPVSMTPLATPSDVQQAWRPFGPPFTSDQNTVVTGLIATASAKLRQACPFNIDTRIANYLADPQVAPTLAPSVVADVVATVVKRFLVNTDGVASSSDATGPYSGSRTFVNRYDKTGSDVRGAIQITESDIDQLRTATPTRQVRTVPVTVTPAMRPRPGYLPGYDSYLSGWPDSDTPSYYPEIPDGPPGLLPWQTSAPGLAALASISTQLDTIQETLVAFLPATNDVTKVDGPPNTIASSTTSAAIPFGRRTVITGSAVQPLTIATPTVDGTRIEIKIADGSTASATLPTALQMSGVTAMTAGQDYGWFWVAASSSWSIN